MLVNLKLKMQIRPTPVRRVMATVTTRPITTLAVVRMADGVEEHIKRLTKEAEQLLLERNRLRKLQGLCERVRIDDELIGEILEG